MIRVGANLTWLVPGRVGGSEEYTVRLLDAVRERATDDIELRIVGSSALRDAYPNLASLPFEVVRGPTGVRPYRVTVESTVVHRSLASCDVAHHFGGRVPARRHGTDVVTIHDLQPLHFPDNFSTVKRRYLEWALPRTAAAAVRICTPSEWVADTVVRDLGVDRERVRAVPSTFDSGGPVDPSIAARLGVGPVVLYPAITHPHKNHLVLLEAFDRVVRTVPTATLVLTGGRGRADAEVAQRAARAVGTVVRPGRVDPARFRGLLARADVLAFPSRYEGFGLPLLEAMHAGVAVVASDVTAIPEVLGGAGLLVDPDDPVAWSDALLEVLLDPEAGAARREAGRRRAEAFSRSVAADRLIETWRGSA